MTSSALALCPPATVTHVGLSWSGLVDEVSGITAYALANRTDGVEGAFADVGPVPAVQLAVAALPANGSVSFRVRACDGVGLCTTSPWSASVHRGDAARPSGGAASLQSSSGASPGFVDSSSPLRGLWSGFDSGSAEAASMSYEACLGTTPTGCQADGFALVGAAYDKEWAVQGVPKLTCGVTYYMLVRATNCAGLQTVVASNGTKLCCTAPAVGRVELRDATGVAASYASDASNLTVSWSGFADTCSGLQGFTVTVSADGSGTALYTMSAEAFASSLMVPASALSGVTSGAAYTVSVVARSHSGRETTATARFTADMSPPYVGFVHDGFDAYDAGCAAADEPIRCAWRQVTDVTSGIAKVEWGVGTSPLATDLIPFAAGRAASAANGTAALPQSGVTGVGSRVYCTVRATNGAGLVTVASSNGVRLVEPSCDAPPTLCVE